MDAIESCNVGPAVAGCAADVQLELIDCEYGDPTMFEAYWDAHKEDHIQISYANERLSYFGNKKLVDNQKRNLWFVHEDMEDAIRDVHSFVGNAVVEDKYIVVGTGSTQLFQAAVYALSNPSSGRSTAVVAEVPYYSPYAGAIDLLKSRLFHWAGDVKKFRPSNDEQFIELVTSPNNPCGSIRKSQVAESSNGSVIHDLAYYWPTFTPITTAADQNIMLFSLSKCTGHGGSRLGWALVTDVEIAQKMGNFIINNTLGVSFDAQVRGAGLIHATMINRLQEKWVTPKHATVSNDVGGFLSRGKFFEYGRAILGARWEAVRSALLTSKKFTVGAVNPQAEVCSLLNGPSPRNSAFIWLKCESGEDCQKLLKDHGILARGGQDFGSDASYARLSLLGRQPAVDILIQRLACLG